jgi:hypothetical protein
MTTVFAIFLTCHGLIHLLGFFKAFGLAELPQLTERISPSFGLLWLMAAVLFVAAAGSLLASSRVWWMVGAAAVAVSFVVIASSWSDAKFGALANLVALAGVVFGFLAAGPFSLRAAYEHEVNLALSRTSLPTPITEADLARLPEPVQRYLRISGVVAQPRPTSLRARMHGRIRSGPEARWMPFTAEQYNFFDEPSRLFYMTASLLRMPFQGFHRYVASDATMRVKVAALVPVLDVSGWEMTQSETVTLFNDMCFMAPGTLIGASIAWQPVDARTARASFTNAGHTILAALEFNDSGELVNFWSDDRSQASSDGKTLKKARWSTPLGDYRSFGSVRLASRGEARWQESSREYSYIEMELDDVLQPVVR